MSLSTEQRQHFLVLSALTAGALSLDDLAVRLKLDSQRLLCGRRLHLVVGDMFYDGLLSRVAEKGTNEYRPTAAGSRLVVELTPVPVPPPGSGVEVVVTGPPTLLPDGHTVQVDIDVKLPTPAANITLHPMREPTMLDEPVDLPAPTPGFSLSTGRPARSFAVPESRELPMPTRVTVPPTPVRGGNIPAALPAGTSRPAAQPASPPPAPAPKQTAVAVTVREAAPGDTQAGTPVEPTLQRLIQAFQHDRARTTAMERCLREIAAVVQRHYPI